ncbi:MAG: hypothetical protein ABUS54_06260 [Actinomycetota bacterium]
MIATTPPPATQVHNLVLNVRSFDSIARQVWGGDAALVTLQLDSTLIRIDKARRGPNAKLAKEIRTLQKQGAHALQVLDPGGSALAKDALSSLRTNLQLFARLLKRLQS